VSPTDTRPEPASGLTASATDPISKATGKLRNVSETNLISQSDLAVAGDESRPRTPAPLRRHHVVGQRREEEREQEQREHLDVRAREDRRPMVGEEPHDLACRPGR
jgi:hypothetical protein